MALAGSFFLMGPKAQWSRMWREERRIATLMYLGTLFLTLVVAFFYSDIWGPKGLYLLILMICQYTAITWCKFPLLVFEWDRLLSQNRLLTYRLLDRLFVVRSFCSRCGTQFCSAKIRHCRHGVTSEDDGPHDNSILRSEIRKRTSCRDSFVCTIYCLRHIWCC